MCNHALAALPILIFCVSFVLGAIALGGGVAMFYFHFTSNDDDSDAEFGCNFWAGVICLIIALAFFLIAWWFS